MCSSYDDIMIVCTLKQVLERKGWSRYKLQKRSGISYPTLHAMFHAKSKGYSSDVLNRLCATLHCKPGDLLRWVPDRFPRDKKANK
jgi:putative transcriptional regulator